MDSQLKANKKWRETHREQYNESQKKYNRASPPTKEQRKEYWATYYEKHKDEILARRREKARLLREWEQIETQKNLTKQL